MDQNEARQALDAMQGAKERLADVYKPFPAWRHAVLALFSGVLVLSVGAPDDLRPLLFLPSVLFAWWFIANERKVYGLNVRGIQRSGNLLFMVLVFLGFFGLIYLARSTRSVPFPSPQALGIAALAALFGLAASVIRRRLYRNGLARSDRA